MVMIWANRLLGWKPPLYINIIILCLICLKGNAQYNTSVQCSVQV